MYKKFDLEDKVNSKQVERLVQHKSQAELNEERNYKMRNLSLEMYKEAIEAFPDLLQQAELMARPEEVSVETGIVLEFIVWGAENNLPIAVQFGESYCDFNGIMLPQAISAKINRTVDPFNDNAEYLS